jgi:hypothetical protein
MSGGEWAQPRTLGRRARGPVAVFCANWFSKSDSDAIL